MRVKPGAVTCVSRYVFRKSQGCGTINDSWADYYYTTSKQRVSLKEKFDLFNAAPSMTCPRLCDQHAVRLKQASIQNISFHQELQFELSQAETAKNYSLSSCVSSE